MSKPCVVKRFISSPLAFSVAKQPLDLSAVACVKENKLFLLDGDTINLCINIGLAKMFCIRIPRNK